MGIRLTKYFFAKSAHFGSMLLLWAGASDRVRAFVPVASVLRLGGQKRRDGMKIIKQMVAYLYRYI